MNDSQKALPQEWADDQTMDVLFSPFREREVNPSSWDHKLKFWTRLLQQHCLSTKSPVFHGQELSVTFGRKNKKPACLDVVVQNMLLKREIQTLSSFYSSVKQSSSWMALGMNYLVKKPVQWTYNLVVKKPLSWTYGQLFGAGDSNVQNSLMAETYVLVEQIKIQADQIYQQCVGQGGSVGVYSYSQLLQTCGAICRDAEALKLAVMWLASQQRCRLTTDAQKNQLVVFPTEKGQPPVVSDQVLQIYQLETTKDKLLAEIQKHTEEMAQHRTEAKELLSKGMKTAAKACLRRKQRLEQLNQKHETAVDNLDQLLGSLQQTHTHKEIIDAYSSGVNAYKELNKRYNLTTDTIDTIIDSVQEVLEDQDELNTTISRAGLPDVSVEELEAELEELLDTHTLPDLPRSDLEFPQDSSLPDLEDSFNNLILSASNPDLLPTVPTHDPVSPPSQPQSVKTVHKSPLPQTVLEDL